MGSVVSTTEASTAGTLTLNWPWKVHSASGRVRLSGLWVRISGQQEVVPDVEGVVDRDGDERGPRERGTPAATSCPTRCTRRARIDSNSSLGTSRMKFDRTRTDSGIAKAIDGRISASRVSYSFSLMMIR